MTTALYTTLTGIPMGDLYQIALAIALIPSLISCAMMFQTTESPRATADRSEATSLITE